MGVMRTLRSSMEANGAKSSSVVMVLVATVAILMVFVALFVVFGLLLNMFDLSECFEHTNQVVVSFLHVNGVFILLHQVSVPQTFKC